MSSYLLKTDKNDKGLNDKEQQTCIIMIVKDPTRLVALD